MEVFKEWERPYQSQRTAVHCGPPLEPYLPSELAELVAGYLKPLPFALQRTKEILSTEALYWMSRYHLVTENLENEDIILRRWHRNMETKEIAYFETSTEPERCYLELVARDDVLFSWCKTDEPHHHLTCLDLVTLDFGFIPTIGQPQIIHHIRWEEESLFVLTWEGDIREYRFGENSLREHRRWVTPGTMIVTCFEVMKTHFVLGPASNTFRLYLIHRESHGVHTVVSSIRASTSVKISDSLFAITGNSQKETITSDVELQLWSSSKGKFVCEQSCVLALAQTGAWFSLFFCNNFLYVKMDDRLVVFE